MDVPMILAGVLMIGSLLAPVIWMIIDSIKSKVTVRKALEGDEEAMQTMDVLASLYEVPVVIRNRDDNE